MKTYTVGLVQMTCGNDPGENLEKAIHNIEEASKEGADVVCLQELFLSPYFCQEEDPDHFDLAEEVPGPTTSAMSGVASRTGTVLVVPLFERRAAGLYHNSAAVIDADGTILGLYRKMHIPDDPSYYEKFYFTPGDLGFPVFDTRVGKIAAMICWDQWYPEGARLAALGGANMVFYPTAIGWHPSEKEKEGEAQREAWQTVQRGHAISNGIYVAAVNRVGHEKPESGGDGIQFWGSSFLSDPQGVLVAKGSEKQEEILLADVDLTRLEEHRRNWPFLRDRRIDAYHGMDKRFLD